MPWLSFLTSRPMQYAALGLVLWIAFSWVTGLVEDRALLYQEVKRKDAEIELISATQRAEEMARIQAEAKILDVEAELDNLGAILQEVRNAPQTDDGDLAPVLLDLLERLSRE